jgi:hypothetical protein
VETYVQSSQLPQFQQEKAAILATQGITAWEQVQLLATALSAHADRNKDTFMQP